MRKPTAVVDLELTSPAPRLDLRRFGDALVTVRLHGRPLASVKAPIVDGRIAERVVRQQLLEQHAWAFGVALAERAIDGREPPADIDASRLLGADMPDLKIGPAGVPKLKIGPVETPLVTVAVCTRDRAADLALCLASLVQLEYPRLDLLVVDNAPATDATRTLVASQFPSVRYVCEPRPGLDWARNRAVLEARGEILAFTDDDVIVERGWVAALVNVFNAEPHVMAVTGLVMPHELETDAQRLFETYGGFGRGYLRCWYRAASGRPVALVHGGAGKFGTGANMAYRRRLFDTIGGFDPALDVGTCTNGGGDLEMFFRVLKEGHTLVYEPRAIVRHRHRREYPKLQAQIANNGVGFYSFLVRTASAYPDERSACFRLGTWWLRWWNLRRFARALLAKELIPIDLIRRELAGSLRGLRTYQQAQRRAADIRLQFPGEPELPSMPARRPPALRRKPEAVRRVDLSDPLAPVDDAAEYERLRVLVSWRSEPLGTVVIDHHGAPVGPTWLRDVIAQQLTMEVLDAGSRTGRVVAWSRLVAALASQFPPAGAETSVPAGDAVASEPSVSVVIATRDRPEDLVRCLDSLTTQRTARPLEIVVVDNNPASGVTRAVTSAYPGVVVVDEYRPGLSYARNRGIAVAGGEIIATTDDDVICPPDWIERLVAPFARQDVTIVTGNVLPYEMESEAQRLFEAYGGLGRGFTRRAVDHDWFLQHRRAVPTWELGCTANAAFRASIFADPEVGLMDEALGAGTPTGCSEDTYVFYKVLRSGGVVAYEPDAYVWHRHRATIDGLRRQVYAYSKGHVAYHLTTWLRDGDVRGLIRVLVELPRTYAQRAFARLRGHSDYPMRFIALEVLGNLAGPWALWSSRRRVRRLGRSAPVGSAGRATSTPSGQTDAAAA